MMDGALPSPKRQRIVAGQLYDSKHEYEQRSIVFSPQYPARSFKLMEVGNRHLRNVMCTLSHSHELFFQVPGDLVKAVEAEEELVIVGSKAGEAVLCSSSKTYGMKRVEQSNCGNEN